MGANEDLYRSALQRSLEVDDAEHAPLTVTDGLILGFTYQFGYATDRAVEVQVLSSCCHRHLVPVSNMFLRDCEGCGENQAISQEVPDTWDMWLDDELREEEPDAFRAWVEDWLDFVGVSPLESTVLSRDLNTVLTAFLPTVEQAFRGD